MDAYYVVIYTLFNYTLIIACFVLDLGSLRTPVTVTYVPACKWQRQNQATHQLVKTMTNRTLLFTFNYGAIISLPYRLIQYYNIYSSYCERQCKANVTTTINFCFFISATHHMRLGLTTHGLNSWFLHK